MHPKVKQAYNEAGFQIPATPQDAREENFRRRTKRAEDKIQKFINQVYRISQGPKKDFIFYELKEVGNDLAGNEDTLTTQIGRYDMPKFRKLYNNATGEAEAVQLAGTETVCEYPYSKAEMERILNSGNSENTTFTLIMGNRKYGGFTREDFINKSFDELAEMAIYGAAEMTGKQAMSQLRGSEDVRAQERLKEHRKQEEEAAREAERIRRERLLGETEDQQTTPKEEVDQRQKAEDKALGRLGRVPAQEDKQQTGRGGGPDETTKIKEEVNFVIRKEDEEASSEGGEQQPKKRGNRRYAE